MSKLLNHITHSAVFPLIVLLLVGSQMLPAAPFDEQISFTQPDGTQLQLHGKGDEFYAVFETFDGYTVIFDQSLRAYCYAQSSGDGNQLVSSGVQVQAASGQALGLAPHLRMSAQAIKDQVASRYLSWDAGMDVSTRWSALKMMAHAVENGAEFGPPDNPTVGTKVGLTLLIDFSDDVATVPQSNIEAFCNGDAYSGYGNNGSVKQYYFDNSNGKLTYSNVVTVYIRAPKAKSIYNDTSKDAGNQARLLINDALTAMKAMTNFDTAIRPLFDALTTDNNNNVIAFNVFYAGGNGGVWSMGLWPHSWSLAKPVELWPGGKKVSRYQVSNIGTKLTLGTFCHENGHMLCGFPDIYDYDYDSTGGAGFFCLMNDGSYGNGGLNPVQICAYLKRAAGWATTVDITSSSSSVGSVSVVGTNFNRFYRYAKPGTATEYYLVECRYKTNRDVTLPASGIAVWHIDELGDRDNQSLKPNTTHANYEVTLVQADNLWDFEKNRNDGNQTDLYYFGNRAAGYSNQLTDSSAPNANWWDGSPSGLALRGFSSNAPTMTFIVGTNDPLPVIIAQPQSQIVNAGFPATFNVVASGFPPLAYQWFKETALITGATASSYTIAVAQAADAGIYSVTVSNQFGSVSSTPATLTILPTVPLPFALNNSNLTWTSPAPLCWYGQTNLSHDSTAAAQTVSLKNGEQASLNTTVTGPGTLSFWWRISSQPEADVLSFRIGSTEQARISGESTWQQLTFYIGAGSQPLQWTYAKDATNNAGQDLAWIDEVVWTAGGTQPFIMAQPQEQTSLGGTPVSFAVTAAGTPDLSYQWRFNGLDIPGATASTFSISFPQKTNSGLYSVRVSNAYGSILSSNAMMALVPLAVAGDNSFGQTRVAAAASEAVAIAAGAWHNLALNADGSVAAWGNNFYGQSTVPAGSWKAGAIAAGGYHSLAITADRSVIAWGANDVGQAAPPANLGHVVAVAAGSWHSLALQANGRVLGWGDNNWGQCTPPADLTNAVAIAAGGNHSLALRTDGTIVAWGENGNAEGFFVGQSTVPPGLNNVIAIAAGEYHSLALKADGSVVAWGDNSQGQCDTPSDLGRVTAIAAGAAHSLALKPDSTVRGWGADWLGQCDPPSGLTNVLAIAAGNSHSVLLVGSVKPDLALELPAWRAGAFSVAAQTYAGRSYGLEYKNSLKDSAWTALPVSLAGNGEKIFLADPNARTPSRCYRVREW